LALRLEEETLHSEVEEGTEAEAEPVEEDEERASEEA
jgi:hypothetical protein